MSDILIIGSGPTALYTLAKLVTQTPGLKITIVEREEMSGTGMPYRTGETDAILLANIASIEIPPICGTFLDCIKDLPQAVLDKFNLAPKDLNDRHYFPRVLLGAWLRSQLGQLATRAEAQGHEVSILNNANAVDVALVARGYRVTVRQAGKILSLNAETVVMATGHVWPKDTPESGHFASPWPSAKLHGVAPGTVGILGSSLSGIDSALTIATQYGSFQDDGATYQLHDDAGALNITLMSRKGLLPEADFWCQIPHVPLTICTPERVAGMAEQPVNMEDIFDLVRAELISNDPAYAARIDLKSLTPETFAEAYFAPRLGGDQFALAAANLEEVMYNIASETAIPWRYTILRLHEAVSPLVPLLSAQERDRFKSTLAPVFIDNYAAVPPLSIRRLLALAQAGILDVVAVGDDANAEADAKSGGTRVSWDGGTRTFNTFVDARGQSALPAGELPFPTLLEQLGFAPDAPLPVDTQFRVIQDGKPVAGLYCASLPFIMHLFPFAQGLTVSHEFGTIIAEEIAASRALCDSERAA